MNNKPIIASITVSSNRSSIIVDAIKSIIDLVDIVLIVDLGITDNTLEIVKELAGNKFFVVKESINGTMADWHNAGLAEAYRLGADWAIMLDTDERILHNGVDIITELINSKTGVLAVFENTGKYAKERFFKLPADAKFTNARHEKYIPKNGIATLNKVRFLELPKVPELLHARLLADVVGLQKQIIDDPTETRWYYYLGNTYENLKQWHSAIRQYNHCANMNTQSYERAMVCFRAALCWIELGKREIAIAICAKGMGIFPGFAELPFLASVQCLILGKTMDAIYWANLALVHDNNSMAAETRLGFRVPKALFDGPYEVLEKAYRVLNQIDISIEYKSKKEAMCIKKLKWMAGDI